MAFSDAQTMTGSHGMQHDAQATAMLTKAIVYAPIGQASRAEQIIERLSNAIVSGLLQDEADRKFNRMRPSMARILCLETRSAKAG